MFIGILADIL